MKGNNKTMLRGILFVLPLFGAALFSGQVTAASNSFDITTMPPAELVSNFQPGTLINPYDPKDPEIAKEGHQIFMETGCNGCHGGTGGGGMGPPLSNQRWVYGKDPDTLFRLVTLGSEKLMEQGYSRKARENVRAPMPPQASGDIVIIESSDRLWKIITWILSLHENKD